ncbi:MAG: DUF4880 domain-containing protein [Burkholderia gladioli]
MSGAGVLSPDKAAIAWEVRLRDGEVAADELAAFEAWRGEADNARAWQALQERLARLRGTGARERAATAAALRVSSASRRKMLRAGFGVASAVLLGVGVRESVRGLGLDADWRSGIGSIETVRLADGTPMTIDAGSRIYRAAAREAGAQPEDIALRVSEGQVLVRMAPGLRGRITLATRDGAVTGRVGTLNVGRIGRRSIVSVRGGDAWLHPARGAPVAVRAGDSLAFSADGVHRVGQPFELVSAWTRGMYVADDVPLSDLVDVFSRHRHGVLQVAGSAGELRISGVFMLGDIDAALRQVAQSAPVTVTRLGPYLTVLT